MIYIVMGVSGCGKSSIGQLLADKLDLAFYDGDDFHPQSNVEKMSSGIALNDQDRKPWLEAMAQHMLNWQQQGGAVLACSALKQSYRDILQSTLGEQVKFVYLKGSKALIGERLAARQGHFMAASLLDSQFNTLEAPEDAIIAPIELTPEQIVNQILKSIK
ncbi:gluconokinase [Catenovulum adriaticum]|uniref:Gluconokinase n=1 Tax=Catenovulum adriaticum TaxID=2984846 RepID=A0ABY7ASH2_9ALTE|nr:gluconokinase [Catenovulum sp. TS8]WAJ72270.1 gluconokinase [Catenovulum sp. TS8]